MKSLAQWKISGIIRINQPNHRNLNKFINIFMFKEVCNRLYKNKHKIRIIVRIKIIKNIMGSTIKQVLNNNVINI